MAFPVAPINGQTYTNTEGYIYVFDSTINAWNFTSSSTPVGYIKSSTSSTPPSATDDISSGLKIGSTWFDSVNKQTYVCLDNTAGAAKWITSSAIVATSFPPSPVIGTTFLNSGSGTAYVWNGTSWIDISAAGVGMQNNYTATADPTVSNDGTQGYVLGSTWINTSTGDAFICANTATGAAIWTSVLTGKFPLLAADPTTPAVGDYWYNTATDLYKAFAPTSTWQQIASMVTAQQAISSVGSGSSTLTMGTVVENFNGTSWATSTSMLSPRITNVSSGAPTSALCFTGNIASVAQSSTELYNGASWVSKSNTVSPRWEASGDGASSTSAMVLTGVAIGNTIYSSTEIYNGVNWVTSANSPAVQHQQTSSGTPTDMLTMGGSTTGNTTFANVIRFNGTAFTTMSNLLTPRRMAASSGAASSALIFGGVNVATNLSSTEYFNGSSWITNPSIGVLRYYLAGSGTSSDTISCGGSSGVTISTSTLTSAVEIYPSASTVKTFTVV